MNKTGLLVIAAAFAIGCALPSEAAERYAIVDEANGVVENVILNDGAPTWLAEGKVAIQSDDASPGWSYAAGAFTRPPPPPPEVPDVVSRVQAFVAMQRAGILDQVQAWIDTQGDETKLIWNTATEFHRNSATLNAAAGALNLSSEQVDQLFITAAQIVP